MRGDLVAQAPLRRTELLAAQPAVTIGIGLVESFELALLCREQLVPADLTVAIRIQRAEHHRLAMIATHLVTMAGAVPIHRAGATIGHRARRRGRIGSSGRRCRTLGRGSTGHGERDRGSDQAQRSGGEGGFHHAVLGGR